MKIRNWQERRRQNLAIPYFNPLFTQDRDKILNKTHNFFFLNFIYLFLDRGEGREKEREGNINVWLPLTRPVIEDLARHVPWRGIELETLWFTGWRSIHWATPARAICNFFYTLIHTALSSCARLAVLGKAFSLTHWKKTFFLRSLRSQAISVILAEACAK